MIAIVDYSMGNLTSVFNALVHVGAEARITSKAEDIVAAQKIVLPGVGAFGDAMQELEQRKLTRALQTALERQKPFLGICLGLQLLFEKSEESPDVAGLGFFKGVIKRFNPETHKGTLKIPHMGWNTVSIMRKKCPLMRNVPDNSYFYFVHSYYSENRDKERTLGVTEYGISFASMLWRDAVYAAQFHPEKSQTVGLQILKNFVEL